MAAEDPVPDADVASAYPAGHFSATPARTTAERITPRWCESSAVHQIDGVSYLILGFSEGEDGRNVEVLIPVASVPGFAASIGEALASGMAWCSFSESDRQKLAANSTYGKLAQKEITK